MTRAGVKYRIHAWNRKLYQQICISRTFQNGSQIGYRSDFSSSIINEVRSAHSHELDKNSDHLNDGVYEDLVSAPGGLTGAQVPEDVLGDAGEFVLIIEEPNWGQDYGLREADQGGEEPDEEEAGEHPAPLIHQGGERSTDGWKKEIIY